MKAIALTLSMMLTACGGAGSNSKSLSDLAWPPADAIQTSSFGSYSCSVTSAQKAGCYDGSAAPYYQTATDVVQVAVGAQIVCTMGDAAGAPDHCTTNLSDPACANPPTSATISCWTPTDHTPVLMDIGTQLGYGGNPLYMIGPSIMTVSGSGSICVTESVYSAGTGAYLTDVSRCGSSITAQAYLQ